MFSDPLQSFHEMVAEAKEEREQVDRLLTISTPRERLLVAVIGLFLLVLASWLFFGNVARTVALDGVLVEAGASAGNPSVQALAWVERGVAPHIEADMPAVIELGPSDGVARTLVGRVAAIAAVPFSEEGAAIESAAPGSVQRVELSFDEGVDPASIAGRECRIVIELGRQPPVALFGMTRS